MTDSPSLVERLLEAAPVENGQIVQSFDGEELRALDALLREAAAALTPSSDYAALIGTLEDFTRGDWSSATVNEICAQAADAIRALTASLSRVEAERDEARAQLKPFAEWARLEELHGSTIGHADIADDETALLVVGEVQVRVGTAGDLRALGLSRARDEQDKTS